MIDGRSSRAKDFVIVQSQTTVTAYFSSKQLLRFVSAGQLFPRLWVLFHLIEKIIEATTSSKSHTKDRWQRVSKWVAAFWAKVLRPESVRRWRETLTLVCCWASVVDSGPTANQRWDNVSSLLGWAIDAAGQCVLVHTMIADNFHERLSTSSSQRGSVWSWMTLNSKGQPQTMAQLTLWPLDRVVI